MKFSNYHYNKGLKNFANSNRKRMTKSEACLWKYALSRRQMMDYQFRRQRPIGNYIADFICLPIGLILEVDGLSHENEVSFLKDQQRDKDLKALGFTTLRFSSSEVLNDINSVCFVIEEWIMEYAICPPPGPRQRGK